MEKYDGLSIEIEFYILYNMQVFFFFWVIVA